MSLAPALAPAAIEKRRLHLLESALAVFSKRGFHETRVDDICAAAGISRATFYRYFDGKESVFDALVDLMSDETLSIADGLDAVTPDAAGFATMCTWIENLLANTDRWGPVVGEIIRPRDEHAAARNRAVLLTARFADLLGERFREGGVADVNPQLAALAVIAMTERVAHQIRTWNVDIAASRVAQALARIALKMLHPDVADPGAVSAG